MKRIRKVVVHITEKAEDKTLLNTYFKRIIVDGIEYWDSLNTYTYDKSLWLAKQCGLRVLERWELCKLYDESENFRSSLTNMWYWSASVTKNHLYAWRFNGYSGGVNDNHRYFDHAVRCVQRSGM